jgi:hypothetical protein
VSLDSSLGAGVHRAVWNLRRPALRIATGPSDDDEGPGGGLPGRWVDPGTYTARLTVNGTSFDRRFEVREDARITLTAVARKGWTDALDRIAALYRASSALADSARAAQRRLEQGGTADARRLAELKDVAETAAELVQRLAALYGNVIRVTEPPTTDQRSQMGYFPTVLTTLRQRWRALGTQS